MEAATTPTSGSTSGIRSGFTILELLVLILVMTLASTVGIPRVLQPRLAYNEEGAQQYLKMVRSAQRVHERNNGEERARLHRLAAQLPMLPRDFQPDNQGIVLRAGYCYRDAFHVEETVLPDGGLAYPQVPKGCWAWPKMRGFSGNTVYWLDYDSGQVHLVRAGYEGAERPPVEPPGAEQLGPALAD